MTTTVKFPLTTERLYRHLARRTIRGFSYASVAADPSLITKERAHIVTHPYFCKRHYCQYHY